MVYLRLYWHCQDGTLYSCASLGFIIHGHNRA
uniref:Uncharacterized protein n=1 Tax=Setaria viridis TaxID=4556 RepID=A0A4U6UKE8_SETVI|nr:hypothetical protein SEVIR_5G184050v2 [Setaria viridis]